MFACPTRGFEFNTTITSNNSVCDCFAAKRLLDSLNFTPLNGKHIRVMFSDRDPTLRLSGKANIFIKNLVPNIDGKSLSDMFGRYGTILSCKVATHFNGQSKG